MDNDVKDHAVVLGGGMAGLLAARVLADVYRDVLIIDRDQLAGVTGPRRGVPHGRHAHGLLAKGHQLLVELFPGIDDELAAAGVPVGDLAGNLRWYFRGRRLQPAHSGLLSISSTRPVLEARVRERVRALGNVRWLEEHAIRGLVTTPDRHRVTGVRVVRENGGNEQHVTADLVIDATGRGSRAPVWLTELGYPAPAESRVKVDLAYTTRHFRLSDDPYGTDLGINAVASPANPRGAFFPKLHDGTSMLSLTGILGNHPPTDPDGFLAFAESVSAPEIYAAITAGEPVDDAVTMHFPASVRRRYEKLRRFPQGFLVIGDAVCSFNPVYGQGMTVAAMEAVVLREHLKRGSGVRARRFFREIARHINVPWDISAGADLGFPGVTGKRTLKVRLGNAYMARLHTAAAHDARLTEAFFRVAGLVDSPNALMRPRMIMRVLRGAKEQQPAAAPVGAHQATLSG